MNEHATYIEKMKKLTASIERKAIKEFSKYPEANNLTLSVSFYAGWISGETQEEATVTMCLKNPIGPQTFLRISPYIGVYGKIRIANDFIQNYNKAKNIKTDVLKLIELNKVTLKEHVELEARRKRNEGSKGFKNPLLSW
jgi:hypothetical protein